MARLERIMYEHFDATIAGQRGRLNWTQSSGRGIDRLPQIFWKDGRSWDEVNVWALMKAKTPGVRCSTVDRLMKYLAQYADFLEMKKLDWQHFPLLKEDRVLWMFRGHLIKQRERGTLGSSTVTNCMLAVIQFYRFAQLHKLVKKGRPLWADRTVPVRRYRNRRHEAALILPRSPANQSMHAAMRDLGKLLLDTSRNIRCHRQAPTIDMWRSHTIKDSSASLKCR
jgi:hypothetical protein